ncbi:uncharacterized protein LOC110023057 [Phalaenopsis equestris]|uniref:uncharacterized protein LOC110023057 n=1 Tax=Phalaenopsis equestris TaxID=78828 RepID=UPI0009E32F74|nr:uncharacterized protein LOC110023057 [Phalaenopsis equestris]
MAIQSLKKGHPDITAETDQGVDVQNENTLKELENEIMSVDAEMLSLNEEYQKMIYDANKVQLEVATLQKRISLSEAILLQSERLKDLSAQISELEKTCSSVGEELQKKYTCPKCQFNNMESSEWTSEAEETAAN